MGTRAQAISRVNRILGWRAAGNSLESEILNDLVAAQEDLRKGKTLPKFLILEDQEVDLPAGEHSVALPTDFARVDDENHLHFFDPNAQMPRYLEQRFFEDAIRSIVRSIDDDPDVPQNPTMPSIYVIRQSTIDFIVTADIDYTLFWNYYRKDVGIDTLGASETNLWLTNAFDWVVGEAALRLATSLHNDKAIAEATFLAQRGRAAVFGEDLVNEVAGGPLQMGANL